MVFEAFLKALQNLTDPTLLMFMVAGAIVGLVFGIIPGIGPLLAMALFLPFAFVLKPEDALPAMIAMGGAGYTGGSITAILINVPGTGPNAATMFDGFPLSKKGEAGRALGAALMSSGLGGAVPVLIALGMVPLVVPMVMAIRSADMVFAILLGLTFIGVLASESRMKGLVSGGLGLLISFIGFQTVTGIPRFDFGSLYLYDGIGLVPMTLGLFAIPEMIILAASGKSVSERGLAVHGRLVWEGCRDVLRHWTLWLRSTLIGYVIGIIPGVGAETATFVAYGQAKQTSKYPDKFGSGVIEGVIAPESANNASTAGALLTTLALGIPGSAAMALLLGAFLMVGLIPGPELITVHLDLSLTLLLVVAIANILVVILCLPAAKQLAKIATVPGRILVPLVLVITFVGAFANKGMFGDVIATLVLTALGLVMRSLGFNRPALFLGFVLGRLFEQYLFTALQAEGPLFFMRPISLSLIFVMVMLFAYGPIKKLFPGRRGVSEPQ